MIRALFPCSFDPIHNGHIDIVRRATSLVDELVVGVYDRPQKDFIFTPGERLEQVTEALNGIPRVKIMGYNGLTVEFCRQNDIQAIFRGLRGFSDFEYEARMARTNHRLAPEIESIVLISSEEYSILSSSGIKEIASLKGDVSTMVPPFIADALRQRFEELAAAKSFSPSLIKRD
jgi:pantetheine-phosphate adenylyltransferase